MSPSFAQTEDVCEYCMAAASGKDIIPVLRENGYDADDGFDEDNGHDICEVDWGDVSPVLEACACRNSGHTLADPKAFYDKFFKEAMDKTKEKLNA